MCVCLQVSLPQRVRVWATSDHRHYDAVNNASWIALSGSIFVIGLTSRTIASLTWKFVSDFCRAYQVHPGDGLCVFEDVAAPSQSQSQSQSSDDSKKPRAFVATIAYKFRSTEISKLLSGEHFSHFYLFVLVRVRFTSQL